MVWLLHVMLTPAPAPVPQTPLGSTLTSRTLRSSLPENISRYVRVRAWIFIKSFFLLNKSQLIASYSAVMCRVVLWCAVMCCAVLWCVRCQGDGGSRQRWFQAVWRALRERFLRSAETRWRLRRYRAGKVPHVLLSVLLHSTTHVQHSYGMSSD